MQGLPARERRFVSHSSDLSKQLRLRAPLEDPNLEFIAMIYLEYPLFLGEEFQDALAQGFGVVEVVEEY